MFTFQTEDDRMIQLVQNVSKSHEVSTDELQFLLACRAKGKLDFLLIDIREMVEYSALSIKGTDVLLPTSTIHLAMDELVKRKIQLGDSNFEYVEVLSGLQPGDKVVVSDMSAYKNKNKLKIK